MFADAEDFAHLLEDNDDGMDGITSQAVLNRDRARKYCITVTVHISLQKYVISICHYDIFNKESMSEYLF